ncbi:SPOR domain-containing protein [Xanthobacter flavus]|uniref:SPOR domain-containing protein n=1 Tax=Xanthobacter flavus TaxID=281 RepID=UPI003726B29A
MGAAQVFSGIAIGVAATLAVQAALDRGAVQYVDDLLSFATPEGRLFNQAKAALEPILFDPYSAKYQGLRSVDTEYGTAVCGIVNAKNRMGAYVGNSKFVYLATGGLAEVEGSETEKRTTVFLHVCNPGYVKSPPRPPAPPPAVTTTTIPMPAPPPVPQAYVVQVASQRTEADARASWDAARKRFPLVLGAFNATIARTDRGQQGVYYRAQVGPFSKSDADSMCEALRNQGGDCVVAQTP